jgi:hypothetical protein
VEELLSQLPKDVMGLGLTRRIQERAAPPSILHSTHREGVSPGASSEEPVKQRCMLSLKQ